MHIQVRGDHMGITDALNDYAEKKLSRLERYFDASTERQVSVTMSVERGMHRVEVMLQVHGILFRAEEQSNDMYASIDLVADKLEEQIHRHKEKLNQRFRDQGLRTRIKMSVQNGGRRTLREAEPQVVRVKRFPMKPMDVEEAMMQMNLLAHDFFVFINAESDDVNVLYRRKDGNYGLIEPHA
ncbi:ribosome-associated translation inhibitor RaiA [Alicyclobacillus cycloheptanicus]|uniref:Ribosome hibernation promoting factor n=1 Tax=Alicyclobacillus cycloheptanicus TaxID=1457 RepID=A0ABT9XLA7_9BACL|nr:ribosome-associated translation inhibitor RaiA [Alicyclobacillus cycloheptanicus]MDQ0191093.1 putative sigma-54 modulation protein [Alicyclobacillus cycloheptanicus]WDL99827.1 ribosome-associated translation inhibitor RaiA [Alicyclobacillus cycloheptanicus]